MNLTEFLDLSQSKSILTLLSLAVGMFIFCAIILYRVDVWAHYKAAEVQVVADHEDFEMSRYRRIVFETMNQK